MLQPDRTANETTTCCPSAPPLAPEPRPPAFDAEPSAGRSARRVAPPVEAKSARDALAPAIRRAIAAVADDEPRRELLTEVLLAAPSWQASTAKHATVDIHFGDHLRAVLVAGDRYFESRLKLRLRRGRAAKKAATGRCEGGKPYGYEKGEAPVLLEILRMARGRARNELIAERLNAQGFRTRAGLPWNAERVRCVRRTEKRNRKKVRRSK